MEKLLRADRSLVLADVDPDSTPGWRRGKRAAEKEFAKGVTELSKLQDKLYAESGSGDGRSVLLVLQATDTAGKGGIVKHVFGGVGAHGVTSHAFKAPSDEELEHDFLWRFRGELPPPGHLGIFDRSHYEDVLIHRVRKLSTLKVIGERYTAIKKFEAGLISSGTAVIKVMLQISPDEQKERLLARLERNSKRWKYKPADVNERMLWDDYQRAYQIAIRKTSTADAPWYVIPANHKWYARLAVQRLLLERLRSFHLKWPEPDYDLPAEKRRLLES